MIFGEPAAKSQQSSKLQILISFQPTIEGSKKAAFQGKQNANGH
jgi:hypothetical protein